MKKTIILKSAALFSALGLLSFNESAAQSENIRYRVKAVASQTHSGTEFEKVDRVLYHWGDNNNDLLLPEDYFLHHYLSPPTLPKIIPTSNTSTIMTTDSIHNYSWNSTTYDLGMKKLMEFNNEGLVETEIEMTNSGTGWENNIKHSYTYDANGNRISVHRAYWDGTDWENQLENIFEFDNSNNMTLEIKTFWNMTAWDTTEFIEYTYDNNNNMTMRLEMTLGNTGWIPFKKNTLTYTNNLVTQNKEEHYDQAGEVWGNFLKEDFVYDANDQWIESTMHDYSNNTWNVYFERENEYDASGKLLNTNVQLRVNGNMVHYDKFELEYDDDLLTVATVYYYNGTSLNPTRRTLYSYNSNDLLESGYTETWDGSSWVSDMFARKSHFYYEEYEDQSTSVEELLSNDDFAVYPNPTTDKIHIKMSNNQNLNSVSIVDISGRVVFQSKQDFNASTITISTQTLANGMYFLEAKSGNQTGVKSFLVQH
ncbi:MAG TPA: T9SS type A sorting domain-containing protein [Chitinophagaceae bacterium]|nr:T9SS type A sorting domain-containing protein [Chitinophagaceae bacterium]